MKIYRIVAPAIVLVAALAVAVGITRNPPEVKKQSKKPQAVLAVNTQTVKPQTFTVEIDSFGLVKPRTQIKLFPQVSGQVVELHPHFNDGAFIKEGDVLVRLDPRDYEIQVQIAQANIASAQLALAEEQARAQQALLDWQRLGNDSTPNELVLRKPQLLAAQAAVASAQANLAQAQLSLSRTQIKAPFTGRILKTQVDVGQIVSGNTELAEIYASDYIEIRLPIKNRDLTFLPKESEKPTVTLSNRMVTPTELWQGRLVRTEAALDSQTQQLHVVAQVKSPFVSDKRQALKIGQYVNVTIPGKTINDAIIIPNTAIYQGTFVYIAENEQLAKRAVTIGWQNEKNALIVDGLNADDDLIITTLGQVNVGTRVKALANP